MHHGSEIAEWRKAGWHEQAEHQNFRDLLDMPKEHAKALMADRFPVPELLDCDQVRPPPQRRPPQCRPPQRRPPQRRPPQRRPAAFGQIMRLCVASVASLRLNDVENALADSLTCLPPLTLCRNAILFPVPQNFPFLPLPRVIPNRVTLSVS